MHTQFIRVMERDHVIHFDSQVIAKQGLFVIVVICVDNLEVLCCKHTFTTLNFCSFFYLNVFQSVVVNMALL